ncbi:PREDICTED: uncharacterized protein LOC109179166 [Ipomoea nil]|uniref:uncharacterized protein LOC109179166 n=1 Tax=Ipomoea nil TaxID=35883 RepID=UPI000901326C|nr:PREDICTED: uncharacterized protein LOC109179166 [Ipomoea nil]
MAAAWLTIGERTTPMNTTGAAPSIGSPAPIPGIPTMGIPSTSATGSTIIEIIFDPESQSNPYFLHPNESPALVLVSTSLDGPNYHPWARAMTMALSCKNKLKFVDGSILKPPRDDRKFEVWGRCNDMVVTWIVWSLSLTIGRSVLWIDIAYGIWRDLKRRFSQQDLFRIAEIKCEIYQTKQGDSSLNEYFTSKSCCGMNSKYSDLFQLHQTGENGTSGNVLMTRVAGGPQQNFKKFTTGNKKPTCTFYGYTGHTEVKCYRKHGFPPGWKPKPRSQGSVNQTQRP